MHLYPFYAHINAIPIPVLPDVASIMVETPGNMIPFYSASYIIAKPTLSFIERQGSIDSSFAAILALQFLVIFFK